MRDVELFQLALGLEEPWRVVDTSLDVEGKRLDVWLDFPRGARFACPECGDLCGAHDTAQKTWRHLDFMQYRLYLTAPLPRVRCSRHGVLQIKPSWARERSGFTLLFEALVMGLVKEMPVAAVAALIGEHDTRVWRVVHHYVGEAVEGQELSQTRRVGIDETSARRGRSYVSVFCDLDERRAVYATTGRDAGAVRGFAQFLSEHGGDPERVLEVCQDMSESYERGVRAHLPKASITFDRYHIRQQLSRAIDEVRRAEAKEHKGLLRHTRYLWLKRPAKLSARQQDWLDELLAKPLRTAAAYQWALKFDDFYELRAEDAAEYLRRWIDDVYQTDLLPLIAFAAMLDTHWEGILRWHHTKVSNGLLEGLNSLIQAAKRRARGYRSDRNYIAMVYLIAGKLNAGPALS